MSTATSISCFRHNGQSLCQHFQYSDAQPGYVISIIKELMFLFIYKTKSLMFVSSIQLSSYLFIKSEMLMDGIMCSFLSTQIFHIFGTLDMHMQLGIIRLKLPSITYVTHFPCSRIADRVFWTL